MSLSAGRIPVSFDRMSGASMATFTREALWRASQESISSSVRTVAQSTRAPEPSTTASPVRARVFHARSIPT